MSPNPSPKTLAHRVGERWLLFFFVVALLAAITGVWALLGRLSTPAAITIIAPPTPGVTPTPEATATLVPAKSPPTITLITVMVGGAVQKPGLYQLSADATVADAIALAGGFSAQADQTALDLPERLQDGAVLTVPAISNHSDDANVALVNLNNATLAELESLPGIGTTSPSHHRSPPLSPTQRPQQCPRYWRSNDQPTAWTDYR